MTTRKFGAEDENDKIVRGSSAAAAPSTSWISELSDTAEKISEITKDMQFSFTKINETRKKDERIPDPVRLIHRLTLLETSMKQLEIDCEEISKGKQTMAVSLLQLQIENANLIRELTASMKDDFSSSATEDDNSSGVTNIQNNKGLDSLLSLAIEQKELQEQQQIDDHKSSKRWSSDSNNPNEITTPFSKETPS
mmetsp:Transcript_4918/g.5712  ORF Transcript_4918/g.5712 Transcript_4918/m.5712 type:complete len:195 (+) Transcript_4918:47-631(+)|eukprot:CAMPEP_0194131980 /NCGR_PEP_ID=MMETSP0152-20130528/2571_1 /TAXON_ID=1049557 /ORGANISM="Thalassiothrix antarctica, Strain L6-D1" /LENGTH=194 /DNA_ID=CAMNT_0038826881 /DNA_START=41 /DNA_END=625 /DNA_ORIENTATION=+